MALTVGDILELTDFSTYLSQQCLNVFTLRADVLEPSVDYAEIVSVYATGIQDKMRAIQVSGVLHEKVVIRNLTNGIDIYEEALSAAGDLVGDGMPSVVAASYRLVRTTGITRHGSKRIVGLAESQISGNSVISGSVVEYTNLSDAFEEGVFRSGTVDNDMDIPLVIVGRYPTGHASAGQYDLTKINDVQSSQFIRITSQTTRRAGRGS